MSWFTRKRKSSKQGKEQRSVVPSAKPDSHKEPPSAIVSRALLRERLRKPRVEHELKPEKDYFVVHYDSSVQLVKLPESSPPREWSVPFVTKLDQSWIELRVLKRHELSIEGLTSRVFFYADTELSIADAVETLFNPPYKRREDYNKNDKMWG